MGGPCYIISEASGSKSFAPPCTDNFQIREFVHNGTKYYSCEQAFQALKFEKGSLRRSQIESLCPTEDESDSDFGDRCWVHGQSSSSRVGNWDRDKLAVMLSVNRSKYSQHEDLKADLLRTGNAKLVGGPSTEWVFKGHRYNWSLWNGRIQMLIREEFRDPASRRKDVLEKLLKEFGSYTFADSIESNQDIGSSLQSEFKKLKRYGLEFPYACAECSFLNEVYPCSCEICNTENPSFKISSQRRSAAEANESGRIPLLLVANADVDLDLTVRALMGSDKINLVGIVSCISDDKSSAQLDSSWLENLGFEVPFLPYSDVTSEATSGKCSDTPREILNIICTYGSRLVVMATTRLSPLARAFQLDDFWLARLIKRVYLRGDVVVNERQCDSSSSVTVIEPNPESSSFRCDLPAAEYIFSELHRLDVPITIIGKKEEHKANDGEVKLVTVFKHISISETQVNTINDNCDSVSHVNEGLSEADTTSSTESIDRQSIELLALVIDEDEGACVRSEVALPLFDRCLISPQHLITTIGIRDGSLVKASLAEIIAKGDVRLKL